MERIFLYIYILFIFSYPVHVRLNYFYIIFLVVLFAFLGVHFLDCNMFEGWDGVELHKSKHCLPVFIEPRYGGTNNARYHIA